jgi:hypothetical protein
MTINPYLAKLRALEAKRPPPADVGGFVSFVGAQSSPIPESAMPEGGRTPGAGHSPATNPENLKRQHLHEPTTYRDITGRGLCQFCRCPQ